MQHALETGRHFQKKQTGFVHDRDAIPTLENALFAYALFRSRLSDHVLEGKSLIEKLLKFEVAGNFPAYLHEFPETLDPYLGLRVAPILFWIAHDFSHVIGGLKQELQACISRILTRAKSLDLPPWAKFRLDAFDGGIGPLPQTLADWGEALVSLQIAEKKGADIEQAIAAACKLWHPGLSLYIGSTLRRDQQRHEPAVSLFDLFMCQWQKHFPKRCEHLHPILLRGALVRPLSFDPVFDSCPTPYVDFNPEGECPLFIAWGSHTFVLAKKHLRVEGTAEELILHPSDDDDLTVNFFFDHHPDHDLCINGKKATCFQQDDILQVHSKGLTLELSFSAEDGKYTGHIMRGNRPSQHACHGEDLFTAFDWRIALRTITLGKSPMRVRVRYVQEPESQPPLPLHASHCPHTTSSL